MTLTRPWAVDAGFPNAADQRKQLAAIYPKEGLFPDPITLAAAGVAFAGAGWAVSARAFVASVKRGGVPFSQTYGSALVGNDGTVAAAWTLTGAPGAGSRIDLLCIRARDTTQGDSAAGAPADGPGGATRSGLPEFMLVTGVAGTPGVAPALPAGYEEVARATVSAGNASAAAAVITQTYDFAFVVGGLAYFRTTAQLTAWTANVNRGQRAYALDTDFTYEWDGAAWQIIESGWFAFTPTWTAVTTPPAISNGALTGRARYVGKKALAFRIDLLFGSTSSGGAGDWAFAIPAPAHATGRQLVPAVATLSGPGWTFFGGATIEPGASTCTPRFPQSTALTVTSPARNADAGGGGGTGIPNAGGGSYSYTNGSRVVIEGIVEIA